MKKRSIKYGSKKLEFLLNEIEKVIEEIQLPERPTWQKKGDFEITLDTPINKFSRDSLWKTFLRSVSSTRNRGRDWMLEGDKAKYRFYQFTNVSITRNYEKVSPSLDDLYDPKNRWLTIGELLNIRTRVRNFIEEHAVEPYKVSESNQNKIVQEIDPFLDWVIPQIVR